MSNLTSNSGKHFYEFGPFRLDPAEHLLTCNGDPVQLPPKAFETLLLLVESSGHILRKTELLEALWPESFVEESNLTQHIFLLRKALGEDQGEHHYIKTVPRVGYRFIAPIRMILDESDAFVIARHTRERIVVKEEVVEHQEETSTDVNAATSLSGSVIAGPRRRMSVSARVASISLVVAIVGGGWLVDRARNPRVGVGAGTTINSIAVLRLEPVSDQDETLGFNLGGEIMARLSHEKGFTVRPWMETRSFIPKHDPLTAGRELGVDMVVDGQVQRAQDRVKVTVRLSSVRTRSLMWTATFDEKLDNISAVEDIIALRITRALSPALTKGGGVALPERYTSSAEAYQAYLNGLYFWDKRSTDGFERSIPYFEQAIAKDPSFAPAYASLAEVGAVVGTRTQLEGEGLISKAMELDDTIGEPHASLGFLKVFFQWKWDDGRQELKRATELSPNFATGHQWYAISLAVTGRLAEALAEMRQARELDPLSAPIAADLGHMYYFAHEYDLAIEEFRKALDLDPGFVIANGGLSDSYIKKGMYKEAVDQYLRGLEPPETVKSLRNAFEESGWRGFLEQTLKRERVALHAYGTAATHMRLGDREQALNWLEKAYQGRDFSLYTVKIDPDFDALHSDPRFEEIIRGMGL